MTGIVSLQCGDPKDFDVTKLPPEIFKHGLLLIRGLPGSGKTTLANILFCHFWDVGHYEADMYFTTIAGAYLFTPRLLGDAHDWCQKKTFDTLKNGFPCLVSNTFSQVWELWPYVEMAHGLNIPCVIIECTNQYTNTHNVPQEVIDKMKARWERIPNVDEV